MPEAMSAGMGSLTTPLFVYFSTSARMASRIFANTVGFCARSKPAVRTVLPLMASNNPSPAGSRQSCAILVTIGDSKPAAISPRLHSSASL